MLGTVVSCMLADAGRRWLYAALLRCLKPYFARTLPYFRISYFDMAEEPWLRGTGPLLGIAVVLAFWYPPTKGFLRPSSCSSGTLLFCPRASAYSCQDHPTIATIGADNSFLEPLACGVSLSINHDKSLWTWGARKVCCSRQCEAHGWKRISAETRQKVKNIFGGTYPRHANGFLGQAVEWIKRNFPAQLGAKVMQLWKVCGRWMLTEGARLVPGPECALTPSEPEFVVTLFVVCFGSLWVVMIMGELAIDAVSLMWPLISVVPSKLLEFIVGIKVSLHEIVMMMTLKRAHLVWWG